MAVVTKTNLPLPIFASGKVRDVYEIPGSNNLLFVATDRVSCFDVVLENGIPSKGNILTQMSLHWFKVLQSAIPSLRTHVESTDLPLTIQEPNVAQDYGRRSMQVRKLEVLPIELVLNIDRSIVRGYITGSAWESYKKTGTVNGLPMPSGLRESQKLDKPLWTPRQVSRQAVQKLPLIQHSTKAPAGESDENISPEEAYKLLGPYAAEVEKLSLELYARANDYALERGIVIADTKFEFGRDPEASAGNVKPVLIDEVLTPDSSRFWSASSYEVGRPQESLDKQFLRDWLKSSGLKGKTGVEIPADIADKTSERYKAAYRMICGHEWEE